MLRKKLLFYLWICFFWLLELGTCPGGTLVTIETQKANLTLALLERFVRLESRLRNHSRYRVLLLLPKTRTAFQDQKLVNESVLEFFKQHDIFEIKVVSSWEEALRELKRGSYDIFYLAGLVPHMKDLLTEATREGVLTVSHLTELVPKGLALSLDLDRRRACILANAETWAILSLKIPPRFYQKICFVSDQR